MDKKKISLVIFSIVFIAILAIFLLPKNTVKAPTKTLEVLCNPFPTTTGEVSCQDAVDVVLEKYPGKITKIDRRTLSVPVGEPQPPNPSSISPKPFEPENKITNTVPSLPKFPTPKLENKTVWLISIITNQEISFPKNGATKIFDVAVSVKEKKILVSYPEFKE